MRSRNRVISSLSAPSYTAVPTPASALNAPTSASASRLDAKVLVGEAPPR